MNGGKEDIRSIFCRLVGEVDLWVADSKEAEKNLAYISGLRDMANAVMDAMEG